MQEQTMVRILHGSYLFGTNTENSDTDYKSVILPSRESILLGRVNISTNEEGTSDDTKANTRFDVDDERHDFLRFTNLIVTGQPMALEMMFAPAKFHQLPPHPIWTTLVENADRVVSRESGKFLGYCRKQALAYGLKGERVDAAMAALSEIERLVAGVGPKEKLGPHIDDIIKVVGSEHVSMETRLMNTGRDMRHLRIANKMASETITLSETRMIASAVVEEYGRRSRAAKEAKGKDWKALSHALRIGYEALELFKTGRITLPLPEAPHLTAVKQGLVHADAVGEEIVDLLEQVELASASSHLPQTADIEFLESLVIEAHSDVVGSSRDDLLLPGA